MEENVVLRTSVLTLDGRELLPAGTEVTASVVQDLANAGVAADWPELKLLEYGTVRKDIGEQMKFGAYRQIFGDGVLDESLAQLMEPVRFPVPVLEGLTYFKNKDFYTYRHILMVFSLSCLLSRNGAVPSEQIVMEASTGPLHDLGKVCVPLQILNKKAPLLRSERDILEQHTVAGYALLTYYLKDAAGLSARVARDHHERSDGSGYPRGISLADRHVEVIAACDIYDALITPRPYRTESYDNRTALEEITRLAEEGILNWDVVRHLVAVNRRDRPNPAECVVSLDKRGKPPVESSYGKTVEDKS